jgi:hypothetical protein
MTSRTDRGLDRAEVGQRAGLDVEVRVADRGGEVVDDRRVVSAQQNDRDPEFGGRRADDARRPGSTRPDEEGPAGPGDGRQDLQDGVRGPRLTAPAVQLEPRDARTPRFLDPASGIARATWTNYGDGREPVPWLCGGLGGDAVAC